jgi:TPR repeat protein
MALSTAKRRYPSLGRFWQKYIHVEIYVPLSAEPQLQASLKDEFKTLERELERLASLGTAWASAWLAYSALEPTMEGVRDTPRAIQLCKNAAEGGDAFAQYIIAWALILEGDTPRGTRYMKSSAMQLFPPAVLDSVTLFWTGWGVERSDDRRILRILRTADRVGHDAAWLWRFTVYRTGKLGSYRLLLGHLLMPFGILRYSLAKKLRPFSAQTFVFDPARYVRMISTGHIVQRT